MASKAIFLDRDGTIIEDREYAHRLEDLAIYPEAICGLTLLKDYKLFIITNQSGIGRGFFSLEDMQRYNEKLISDLKKHRIIILGLYYCPHVPEDHCDCRKPSAKFVDMAVKEHGISRKDSFVIGDKPTDVLLGNNAGIRSIYLLTGQGQQHLSEARKQKPYYVSADLSRAADFIESDNKKLIDRAALSRIIKEIRKTKKRIVTLNGTFDILHKGHDYIISEAKKQGDIFIMAINSDSSVRGNKGPDRPINNEMARARAIAAYKEIDYVTIFDESTPVPLLDIIKPDVHVNGSEYGKDCIEAPVVKKNGGRLHIVSLIPGYSSTRILNGEKLGQ